jgi:hypothetical protein
VADKIMVRISTDENLHMVFYRDIVAAALRLRPSETVMAIADEVLDFQMPGIGIPGFRRKAAAAATSGIILDDRRTPGAAFPLQHLKPGDSLAIQGANLTIKDRFFCVYVRGNVREFGILRRHFDLVARHKPRFAVLKEADRSITIPLRFENPIGIREGFIDQRCQHRFDLSRHTRCPCGRANRQCSRSLSGHLNRWLLGQKSADLGSSFLMLV